MNHYFMGEQWKRNNEGPETEIVAAILAGYAVRAKEFSLNHFMKWDVYNALIKIQSRPMGWDIFRWLKETGACEVHEDLCNRHRHLQSIAYGALINYTQKIKEQLFAEASALRAEMAANGCDALVPVIESLGITKDMAWDMQFHGHGSEFYNAMFAAALAKRAAPSASTGPRQAPSEP